MISYFPFFFFSFQFIYFVLIAQKAINPCDSLRGFYFKRMLKVGKYFYKPLTDMWGNLKLNSFSITGEWKKNRDAFGANFYLQDKNNLDLPFNSTI